MNAPKVGDKVTTRYGENLEVLEVKTLPAKSKKGQVIEQEQVMFLAQSGENLCWFPLDYLESRGTK